MGLFDYVIVSDPRFVCSEGHALSNEEFQSKDFGCVMGRVLIGSDGAIAFKGGYLGTPEVDENPASVYCTCRRCPAFVQWGTGNTLDCGVEFEVRIENGRAVDVKRTSTPTSEWLVWQPAQNWTKRCEGPMPYADAVELHAHYKELRPEAAAAFDRWAQARSEALKAGKSWPLSLRVDEYPVSGDPE